MKIKYLFLALLFSFLLSGCVNKSDIKDNFCGVHLNYQYCKCAFHGEFCSNVGMNKGEAKKYVYQKYNEWKNGGTAQFRKKCEENNGFIFGKTCVHCKDDEEVKGNKCVLKNEEAEEEKEDEKEKEEKEEINNNKEECKYDSDCDNICEGNIMWKQGCNPRKNKCEKTFDTDCSKDIEKISNFSFPKICQSGECIRNQESIDTKLNELKNRQKEISNEVKKINASRADLNIAMLDANKRCLNGLADMTNVAIMEFATRVSSVLTGGLPSLADVSVDYANDSINKLYGYLGNATPPEEQKLKPHEYIKLNCDLYHYFIALENESSKELDKLLDEAKILEEQINSF